MADNDNDLFNEDEEPRDLDQEIEDDAADEIDEIFDGDGDEDAESDDEPELDEYGDPVVDDERNLAGATLSHTISDEAGTRLDLTDIHGGALKPIEMSQEMKTSFLEYSMSVIVAAPGQGLPSCMNTNSSDTRICTMPVSATETSICALPANGLENTVMPPAWSWFSTPVPTLSVSTVSGQYIVSVQ